MIEYEFIGSNNVSEVEIESINLLLKLLTVRPADLDQEDMIKICNSSRLLVAKLTGNKKIVGMATLVTITIPTGKFGRIEDVVVDNNHRGQGIGKTLILKLIEEAKMLDLKRIDLTSNPRRIEANNMYQSLGFDIVDTNLYRLKL